MMVQLCEAALALKQALWVCVTLQQRLKGCQHLGSRQALSRQHHCQLQPCRLNVLLQGRLLVV